MIVCNPPYGERLASSRSELVALYKDFASFLSKKANNKVENVYVVTPQPEVMRAAGLVTEEVCEYNNGGLNVVLVRVKQ